METLQSCDQVFQKKPSWLAKPSAKNYSIELLNADHHIKMAIYYGDCTWKVTAANISQLHPNVAKPQSKLFDTLFQRKKSWMVFFCQSKQYEVYNGRYFISISWKGILLQQYPLSYCETCISNHQNIHLIFFGQTLMNVPFRPIYTCVNGIT